MTEGYIEKKQRVEKRTQQASAVSGGEIPAAAVVFPNALTEEEENLQKKYNKLKKKKKMSSIDNKSSTSRTNQIGLRSTLSNQRVVDPVKATKQAEEIFKQQLEASSSTIKYKRSGFKPSLQSNKPKDPEKAPVAPCPSLRKEGESEAEEPHRKPLCDSFVTAEPPCEETTDAEHQRSDCDGGADERDGEWGVDVEECCQYRGGGECDGRDQDQERDCGQDVRQCSQFGDHQDGDDLVQDGDHHRPIQVEKHPIEDGDRHSQDGDHHHHVQDENHPVTDDNYPVQDTNYPIQNMNHPIQDRDRPVQEGIQPIRDGDRHSRGSDCRSRERGRRSRSRERDRRSREPPHHRSYVTDSYRRYLRARWSRSRSRERDQWSHRYVSRNRDHQVSRDRDHQHHQCSRDGSYHSRDRDYRSRDWERRRRISWEHHRFWGRYSRDRDRDRDRWEGRKGNTVYVYGCLVEDSLRSAFSPHGNIIALRVDSAHNCAFVTFDKMESADRAVAELNGSILEDGHIKVSIARKQPMLDVATGRSEWPPKGSTHDEKKRDQDALP